MKTTPILMQPDMVRATLREIEHPGTGKTQTRRMRGLEEMNGPTSKWEYRCMARQKGKYGALFKSGEFHIFVACPYGGPMDMLYVRETWATPEADRSRPGRVAYDADGRCGTVTDERVFFPHGRIIEASGYSKCFPKTGSQTYGLKLYGEKWIPSIHMYRWASRITLPLVSVLVERLAGVSETDSIAEGIECTGGPTSCTPWRDYSKEQKFRFFSAPSASYRSLWESINGAGSWDKNPWVWRLEFKPVLANVDGVIPEVA